MDDAPTARLMPRNQHERLGVWFAGIGAIVRRVLTTVSDLVGALFGM
jgi:hypothetical protein